MERRLRRRGRRVPAGAAYAIEPGAGPFLVGLLAATAAFAGVPGAVRWGRLAARTGRRRVFVVASLALTSSLALVLVGVTLAFVGYRQRTT